jgi:hypothetical protein
MVTTVFYNSYDEEEEEFTKEEGEDTDSEDPEYGNPELKFMKNRVQQVSPKKKTPTISSS